MASQAYEYHAKLVLKEHLKADSLVPYVSIICGIFACKMVYDLSKIISAAYIKSYSTLSKMQRIEWNNRAISTVHAIFITAVSLYFVFWSDLFLDKFAGLITHRSSLTSMFTIGVSIGYFLADLGMILWFYPSLGGVEFVAHHLIAMTALAYAVLTGQIQLYAYLTFISESTTPEINLRWYLEAVGKKRSTAYLVNGIIMFLAWLVARILLFVYIFYHIYLHFDQVRQMHTFGIFLTLFSPSVLFVMNLMWFGKILKGLKKTLAKKQ